MASPGATPAPASEGALPRLREDLHLLPAERDEYGAPNWTIHDPVRNRYYRIGMAAFEMLSRWHIGTIKALKDAIAAETTLSVTPGQIIDLSKFLHANGLLERTGPDAVAEFSRIEAAGRPPLWKWLVHNYLFLRLPLVRPDRFLRKTQPVADFFASRPVEWAILAIGLIGIFLTFRQWDQFLATFLQFANWQGAMWIALTLTGTKILHELGHAYTATRYGCRVPTMGVALLVLYPVLYTDTSDAWRLTSREQKLRIGAAGIRVELALALIATLLWHVVPAGPAQSALFLIASTTWISTLLINLSPFLRFDGYYLLADYLKVANLQDRAFALGRWRLRELLFAFGDPAPEPMKKSRRRLLTFFAYGVWIYRFFLFLGIAIVVYHLFFKLLGVLLFAIEILWFILMPLVRETKIWWARRADARMTRGMAGLALAAAFALMILVIPWRHTVTAAAMLESSQDVPLLTASDGQVTETRVRDGQHVVAGEVMFRLRSPGLDHQAASARLELQDVRLQLAQAHSNREWLADAARLEKEVLRLEAGLASLEAQAAQLTILAPFDGQVRDISDMAKTGTWVPAKTPLARVISPGGGRIIAYVSQSDIARLQQAATSIFIPDDFSKGRLEIILDDIDQLGAPTLEVPALASVHGGPIAAHVTEDGGLIPVGAIYRVTGHVAPDLSVGASAGDSAILMTMRGSLEITAPAVSLIYRIYENMVATLLRETAF